MLFHDIEKCVTLGWPPLATKHIFIYLNGMSFAYSQVLLNVSHFVTKPEKRFLVNCTTDAV